MKFNRPSCCLLLSAVVGLCQMSVAGSQETQVRDGQADKSADKPTDTGKSKDKVEWISLFDGKTLKGWEATKFGGEGDVTVKDGQLILDFGADLTGVHTKRKLPKINYEVELEAMRVDGSDFFCGFTFPVNDSFCSLIVGGWVAGFAGSPVSTDWMPRKTKPPPIAASKKAPGTLSASASQRTRFRHGWRRS